MDGFDIEKDLSPFKSATVSDSTVKVDDVISQINQLPQTTQLTDVRAIQIKQQEAHDMVMSNLKLMLYFKVEHDKIVDQAAEIQK